MYTSSPPPASVREASCSRRELTETHSQTICKGWEIFGALISKWAVFLKALPSGYRDLSGREGRKIKRARGDGELQRNSSPRYTRTDAHKNSQRRWQCTQDLHRFKQDEVPAPREEKQTGVLFHPNQEGICNWYLPRKRKPVIADVVTPSVSTIIKGRPHA